MYYCKSRYYNPMWCRWLNADSVNYLNIIDINGTNLYQYCSNNPVMYVDPSGHFAISAIIGIIIAIGALALTANDIYQIAIRNVYVDMNKTSNENVHIENSYKLLTPWMRYGYSFYLNHFNSDTKDIIQ